MLDGLTAIDYGNFSGYAIGVMCFLAVLKGWLFTRAHYNDVVAQRDKFEEAFWRSEEAGRIKDQQVTELLEIGRATKHFMEAFPKAVYGEDRR